ncbi:conserved oligomeric Golgi complex subunit 8-like [Asterias rubens]|uniref:conserved oligomeric Golgi complex subunit 8-like n=1 Tax=Asterias rubens TaxID=7604 RepID=UPI0014552E6E|nr:conserved oligomeric Golgi complex subunit 8-like [Asterias rubens]
MAASIDVEDETILASVFKDVFPDSWRENPDFALYLAELSSYGVDKLNREPDRLAEERSQILQQTQELAFHNYKTFIETAECSKEIVEDFNFVEKHVNSLLVKLPSFSEDCNKFMKEAQQISISRRMNNLTLTKHTQLLEILEIPQLMDTCVRNSYYEEALELSGYVKRLEKKHTNIPVIQDIVNEVKGSTQLMLNQMLQQLRTNIQLPACLRLIGYLRRMDLFSESELRIKFLQARDTWFQGILASIAKEDAYFHITKVIEVSRVHLFDIITQYRAIFSDDDPVLSSSPDSATNEGALFHGWVGQKVSQFLSSLETDLTRGVGGRLDSLLGQCMYFGLSFSRVGADFRGLLSPLFQEAALRGFTTALDEGTKRFAEAMHSYTLIATPSLSSSTLVSGTMQGDKSLAPPTVLMDHAPLAMYTNAVLSAFNDLRLCAPVALAQDVATALNHSLERVVQTTLAYHRAEESTFNDKERDFFSTFCQMTASELLPYLNHCLQALFPMATIAQTLGVTVADLQKMGNIGTLDVSSLTEPLKPLLPPEPEIQEPDSPEPQDSSEAVSDSSPLRHQSSDDVAMETPETQNKTEDPLPEETQEDNFEKDATNNHGQSSDAIVIETAETQSTEEDAAGTETPEKPVENEMREVNKFYLEEET